jgi:hypothetical protein
MPFVSQSKKVPKPSVFGSPSVAPRSFVYQSMKATLLLNARKTNRIGTPGAVLSSPRPIYLPPSTRIPTYYETITDDSRGHSSCDSWWYLHHPLTRPRAQPPHERSQTIYIGSLPVEPIPSSFIRLPEQGCAPGWALPPSFLCLHPSFRFPETKMFLNVYLLCCS